MNWLNDLTIQNKHQTLTPLKADVATVYGYMGGKFEMVISDDATFIDASGRKLSVEQVFGRPASIAPDRWGDWQFAKPRESAIQTLRDIRDA